MHQRLPFDCDFLQRKCEHAANPVVRGTRNKALDGLHPPSLPARNGREVLLRWVPQLQPSRHQTARTRQALPWDWAACGNKRFTLVLRELCPARRCVMGRLQTQRPRVKERSMLSAWQCSNKRMSRRPGSLRGDVWTCSK